MIRLTNVHRRFRVGSEMVPALTDINEEVITGEHIAIMGPSGSGKSTLLNILGCLDRSTEGAYELDGRDVSLLDDDQLTRVRRHLIGFVFQTYHLVRRLTAVQNVALPMVFAGISEAERHRRAMEMLASVGLSNRASHRPSELTGGQRQRVVLARAAVMRPRLLLADEPTGNLDTGSGARVLNLLDQMNDRGATLVVVTHDPVVARRADRVWVMTDGRVVGRVDDPYTGALIPKPAPPADRASAVLARSAGNGGEPVD